MKPFEDALHRIDAANAGDPNMVSAGGLARPAELVYGERMSMMMVAVYPNASEALRLAARAQHLRRWTVPRDSYPMDRSGYHRWRNDLKRKHADWTSEILAACGYDPQTVSRVAALIRKDNLKQDLEAQALEDVACLVFLRYYAEDFAAKHDPEKFTGILRKTWAKMSGRGHAAAHALMLSPGVRAVIAQALTDPPPSAEPDA